LSLGLAVLPPLIGGHHQLEWVPFLEKPCEAASAA